MTQNELTSPFKLAESMGDAVCKSIDTVAKEMLGRHHIRGSNIKRAKKQMAKQDIKMLFKASKKEEIVYFWWELLQGEAVIDTSTRVKAVMQKIDSFKEIYGG